MLGGQVVPCQAVGFSVLWPPHPHPQPQQVHLVPS